MGDEIKQLTVDLLSGFLSNENSLISVAEFHGLISGQICGGTEDAQVALEDVKLVLAIDQIADFEALNGFYRAVLLSLQDEDMGFMPLLPDDDSQLSLRLKALSDWCQGFLTGFAFNNQKSAKVAPLTAEVLNDFAAISQIDTHDDTEWHDSGENDYNEVVEFIRLSVMNLYFDRNHNEHANKNLNKPENNGKNAQKYFGSKKIH